MGSGDHPTYALAIIQAHIKSGTFFIRESALTGAFAMGLDRYDIEACVLALDDSDFFKTMASEQMRGLMQDVYKPLYMGQRLYVKVQLNTAATLAVVISFKEE